MTGLELAAELARQDRSIRVIVLTTFSRPGYLRRAQEAGYRHHSCRVDDWRGGGRRRGLLFPAAFAECRCLTPRHSSVSSRRSSNRTCRFPASGSRTRSCLRPRKARRTHRKAGEPVLLPEPLVRESHVSPGPHLMLATEPLAQPPGGVLVNRRVCRPDLPQDEIVRPAGQQPVQAHHDIARRQESVTPRRRLTHPPADALDARRARAGADVGGVRLFFVGGFRRGSMGSASGTVRAT